MTYDVREYNSGRLVRTVRWNLPIGMARFYKRLLENSPHMDGSKFEIELNKKV